ncbi:MAG: substrate-binding domain-containing protein [Deltaproteobacteria bacterium]|nr:substrate-binding domain-containing protein [Deltaproteobacteria bacterium]
MIRILLPQNFLLVFFVLTLSSRALTQERPQKIIIAGAQSIAPLAAQFSTQYRKDHPGIEIEILGGGTNYAINAARRGEIDIGLVTRSLTPEEKGGLYVESFGQDAIILLTYPGNPVKSISVEQIRRIYLGKTTNWRALGGEDKGIIPLTREKNAGIHAIFFQHLFGKGFNSQEKAFTIRASKERILMTVKRIEGSIGYGIVRLEEAERQGVKVLGIEGKLPTAGNIREGLYPLVRPQLVISRPTPTSVVRDWMHGFARFASRGATLEVRP